jgi:hypothetical protein
MSPAARKKLSAIMKSQWAERGKASYYMRTAAPFVCSLEIVRPLAFLDVEATGIAIATDRIVELTVLNAKY